MTSKSDSNLDSSFSQSKKAIRPNLLKLMPAGSGRKKNRFKLKSSESGVRDRYLDDPAYTDDISHLAIPMRRNSGPESERRKSFSIIQSHFSTDSGKANRHYNDYEESHVQKRKFFDKKKKKCTEMEKKMYQGRCESSSSDELEYSRRGQSLDRHIIKHQKKLHSSQHDINKTSLDHKKYKMYAKRDFVSGNINSFQQKYHSSTNYGSDYKKSSSKNSSRPRERFNTELINKYQTDEMQRDANNIITPDDDKTKDLSRFQIGKRLLKGEIGIKSFNYYLLKEGLKSSKKTIFKHLNANDDESKSFDNVSRSDENIYEEIYFVDKNKKTLAPNPDCDLCIQECTRKNCDICRANDLIGQRAANEKLLRQSEIAMTDKNVNMKDLVQHRQNVLQYQSYNPNNPGVYKIETTPVAFTNDYNPGYQIPNKTQQQSQHQQRQIYQQQSFLNQNATNTKSSSSSDSIHQKSFTRQHMQPCLNDELPPLDQLDVHGPKIHKTDSKTSIVSENISMKSSENSNNYHKTAEMSDSSIGDSLFSYSAQRRFFGSSESCRFGYECRRCSYDGDKVSFSDTCRYDCRNCDCSSSYFSSDFDEVNFSRNNSTRWSANMLHQDDEAGRKTKQYAQDFFKHVTNVKKKTQSQMIAESISRDSSLSFSRSNNQITDSKPKMKQQAKILPNAKSSISSASKSSSSSTLHDQIDNSENNRKKGAVSKITQSNKNERIKIDNLDKSVTNTVVNDQKRSFESAEEQKTGKTQRTNSDTNQNSATKFRKDTAEEPKSSQLNVTENVGNSPKRPEWLELEDDEVFEAAVMPDNSVTSVGATNSNQINPTSVPSETKDTTCAEQMESKQTTRTTPDKFAPTNPNSNECVQPSSVVMQSPTQYQSRLFEPTAECKKITRMDHQQQNRQYDEDGSRNANTKIDLENRSMVRNAEEKSKEEVVILSTEKSSNFSKIATISISSDVHVAGDTVNRYQLTDTKRSPPTHTTPETTSSPLFDSNELPDFPLPDLPVTTKSRNTTKTPVAEYHHSLPTSYKTKQRSIDILKQFPLQRTSTDNMLSRKLSNRRESDQYLRFNDDMPKYLFGDQILPVETQKVTRPDEKIFLNKSGWVQVNQRRTDKSPVRTGRRHSKANVQDDIKSSNLNRFNSLDRSENLSYHQPSHKFSKIEELISRDEARSINVTLKKFELDPRISALLNDRPGFLPIKRAADNESPPPITPIISPPPAFQDSKSSKPKSSEMIAKIHLSVNKKINSDKMNTGNNKKSVNQSSNSSNNNLNNANTNNKGMVFSRSFEYDNREPRQYNEIFSKSFDYDFKTPFTDDKGNAKDKSKTFTSLTGVSPNYLTKKERSLENSRDNSPQHHQYLEPLPIVRQIKQKSHIRTTLSIRPEKFRSMDEEKGRSRRAQFTKTNNEKSIPGTGQGFRSFDASMAINKRLNSCDSGARSDLSNDEIDSDNHSNGRQSNYLFSQSRHTQSVIKKQRSLTPDKPSDDQSQICKQRYVNSDKRITKNSSIESQGSAYLKSSSSSRSSILDRQRLDDNKFISSRSSSTSSFSGGEHETMNFNKSRYMQQDNQMSAGSRIRRSRSLQLTERSPCRSKQAFKISSDKPNAQSSTKYAQLQRDRPNKRSEQDKQHSFEAEYNKYQYNSKLDFDKSRSFDDDYTNDKIRVSNFINENRSLSNDRVFSNKTSKAHAPTTAKPNMALSYGARLYDHEMMYDMARKVMDRSPIMEFNDRKRDPSRSRERSPNSSSNEHLLSNRNPKNHKDRFGTNAGDVSPNEYMRNRLSPGSEVDIVHDYNMKYKSDVLDSELIKEAQLVTEFLYGNRTKAEILLNQRRKEQKQLNHRPGTMSSSGSCTAISCDFWPHCGITQNIVTDKTQHLKPTRSHDDLGCNNDIVPSVCVRNRFFGSNNLHIENQLFAKCSVDGDGWADNNKNKTVIKLTAKPPIYERLNSNTAKCLLDDREMPITREREGLKLEQNIGLHIRGSTGSDIGLPSDSFNLRFPALKLSLSSNGSTQIQKNLDCTLRSVSLPRIISTDGSTTDEDFIRSFDSFTITKLKNPMRAVSCPSIIENHLDRVLTNRQNEKDTMCRIPKSDDFQHQNQPTGSVFQKLKNTFSNLKGKNVQTADFAMVDADSVYHFGPLKWRTSKERRKVKQLRRDKCNSGDSGIHVEHDIDSECNENVPPINIKRNNSSKDQKIKEMKIHRSGKKQLRNLRGRSASQPNGLNTLYRDRYESDSLTSDHNFQEIVYAEVLFPFEPLGDQELALEKGALVEVIRRDPGPWWWGQIKYDEIIASIISGQSQGWFPKDFVRIIPALSNTKQNDSDIQKATPTKEENFVAQHEFADAINRSIKLSPSKGLQSSEVIRENVVKELLETEIKYVNLLSSLCNGFLDVLRQKEEIFSRDSLALIFANIEQIWQFQQTFLDALRNGIQQNRIAETFIEFQSAFMVYSIYCNSYSRALMELESFSENEIALRILEDCRIAQNLPELPLSAHLLAPIQRLCRYPLHLSELVKFTPVKQEILKLQPSLIDITKSEAEMIDCKETLESALGAMKRVTEMVNEGKRHSEYLFRIQSRIDDFQGPPISLHSTRLFLQSDAIHMTPNIWNNTYTLFLFDHQIVYCKKDLLKRTQYLYKGRIFLDNCRILNLPDGKMFGVTLKNALRLYCVAKSKWLDFCFRSSSSKLRFLNTLSAERQFCGQNLFISELAGEEVNGMLTDEDDVSSDRVEYVGVQNDNVTVEQPTVNISGISGIFKKSDTLPKKSRKLHKDMTATSFECHSNSLGRRRINNWFRKARSTNSTPSHSPTHQMITSNTNSSSSSSTNTIGLNSIKPKQKKSSIFVSSSS